MFGGTMVNRNRIPEPANWIQHPDNPDVYIPTTPTDCEVVIKYYKSRGGVWKGYFHTDTHSVCTDDMPNPRQVAERLEELMYNHNIKRIGWHTTANRQLSITYIKDPDVSLWWKGKWQTAKEAFSLNNEDMNIYLVLGGYDDDSQNYHFGIQGLSLDKEEALRIFNKAVENNYDFHWIILFKSDGLEDFTDGFSRKDHIIRSYYRLL